MAGKRINLALQGGGAHGAYTWGVLDRLLESPDIEIAAMSGTSAGALNGAAVKAGFHTGGAEGARENLTWLWERIGQVGDLRMPAWMQGLTPGAHATSMMLQLSPAVAAADALETLVSPYAYGPFYSNPLRPIVEKFDYGHVCRGTGPELHVCATNVRTGKVRVFTGDTICPEAILASACLPTIFQAVEIDDPARGTREAYWDGGYAGNPALFPLFRRELPEDIVIININPLVRDKVPKLAADIQNRIDEISFNGSLLRELRAISFVQRLLAGGKVETGAMKRVLVHMIKDDALMNDLSLATKMVPLAPVLIRLRDAGRAAADAFLDQHLGDLNERQTVDLIEMFG